MKKKTEKYFSELYEAFIHNAALDLAEYEIFGINPPDEKFYAQVENFKKEIPRLIRNELKRKKK